MPEKPRREFLRSVASFALLPAIRTETELILHNGQLIYRRPGDDTLVALLEKEGQTYEFRYRRR